MSQRQEFREAEHEAEVQRQKEAGCGAHAEHMSDT